MAREQRPRHTPKRGCAAAAFMGRQGETNSMSDEKLKSIRGFLLDMDGTFYLSETIYPFSLGFMEYIASRGIDYLFMTNNSTRSADHYAKKLQRLGFCAPPEKVLTSGEATARFLWHKKLGAKLYVAGTPILEQEFRDFGFTLTDEDPDFAVIGFDTTLTYEKLWKICDFVRLGVAYIATHPDFNCPVDSETGFMPDIGGIIAFVDATTGKRPKVIGKPNAEIVNVAMEKLGLQPEQIAVVGDRLYTDIASGINAGMLSILVLSGETDEAMLAQSKIRPDLVFRDLGALQERMMELGI